MKDKVRKLSAKLHANSVGDASRSYFAQRPHLASTAPMIHEDEAVHREYQHHRRAGRAAAEEYRERATEHCWQACRSATKTLVNTFNPEMGVPILQDAGDDNVVSCGVIALTSYGTLKTNSHGYGFVFAYADDGPYNDRNCLWYSQDTYTGMNSLAAGTTLSTNNWTGATFSRSPHQATGARVEDLQFTPMFAALRVTNISKANTQNGKIIGWVADDANNKAAFNQSTNGLALETSARKSSAVGAQCTVTWMNRETKFASYTAGAVAQTPNFLTHAIFVDCSADTTTTQVFDIEFVTIFYVKGRDVSDLLTRAIQSSEIFGCLHAVYSSEEFLRIRFDPITINADQPLQEEADSLWKKVGGAMSALVEVGINSLVQAIL